MALHIMRLEERILFDASAAGVVAQAAADAKPVADAGHDAAADHAQDAQAAPIDAPAPSDAPAHVLVVSADVDNAQNLANAAANDVLVVLYDPNTSSLSDLAESISSALDGKAAASIAFATHGQNGLFQLTKDVFVTATTLEQNEGLKQFWTDIGSMMTENGRVDLLGCNLGGTDYGLLHSLNQALDASGNDIDIAASTDITGNNPGQNWILEVGNIDAGLYFNQTELLSWSGDLAQILVTNTDDSGAGSLRAAILEANATPGLDTITFADLDVSSDQTITLLSDLPWINESVIIDATTAQNYAFGTQMVTLVNPDGPAFILNSTDVTIKGLDIRSHVRIDGGANTLESNRLTSVTSQASSGYQTIENNIVSGTINTNGAGANVSGNLVGVDADDANINTGSGIQIRGNGASIVSGNTLGYGAGISVVSDAHTLVENNYIGVTAGGVNIGSSYAMTIGSDATLSGNTIGYANEIGLAINGGNITLGANSIGTDSTGTANYQGYQALVVNTSNSMVFDGNDGLKIRGAIVVQSGSHTFQNMDLKHASITASSGYQTITNNVVGGMISMYGAAGATITGNRIGVDENDADINAAGGIQVAGSEDNIISENILGYGAGISVASAGYTTLENNYIGVTADGVNIAGITWTGMTISSDATLEGNTIGNIWEQGLVINGGNITLGTNSIGTDSTGTANYGIYQALVVNADNNMVFDGDAGFKVRGGIVIRNGSHIFQNMDLSYSSITVNNSAVHQTITNNVIGGTLSIQAGGVDLTDNLIGVDADDANINIGSGVDVGGNGASLISGNTFGYGARISVNSSALTTIEGNYIGVTAGGTNIAGTTWNGIIASTSAIISENTIAYMADNGLLIQGNDISITGNTIRDSNRGIFIQNASDVFIGGTGANEGNIIANNGTGVFVHANSLASIRGNSMYGNGTAISSNVPDAPTVTIDPSYTKSPTSLSLSGLLASANGSDHWVIDFYANPTGEGQARYYLGSTTVDLTVSDTFNFTYNGSTTLFDNVVATATDLGTQNTFNLSASTSVTAPPVATDNTLSGTEDTTYIFSISDFTYNDTDGDALDSVKITSFPPNGTLKLNGSDLVLDSVVSATDIIAGLLTFEPDANFNGNLGFNFLVNAGGQDSNTALITVNFAADNDAPTAGGNTIKLPFSKFVVLTLANFAYSDIDGDAFHSVRILSTPASGTFTLDGVAVQVNDVISAADIAAGKLTYLGTETNADFTYQVSDGALYSASAQFDFTNPVPILVTNLNDSGAGSLRQAIIDANAAAGFDVINFSLAISSGARTINLLTILPTITGDLLIDATTAGGYNFGTNMVTLFGNNTSVTADAFRIQGDGVVVRGFDIVRFYDYAINVVSGSNHLFENNIIGLDLDGNVSANWYGFRLSGGGSGTIIRDNVISGNSVVGISTTSQNALTIQGNLIGTDRLGTLDKGNSNNGINISGGSGHQIINNVISGNNSTGIILSSVSNTTVQGNKIGVGLDGATQIANIGFGISASGGSGHQIIDNVISGNNNSGLSLSSLSNATVQGNKIGVALDGVTRVANGSYGLFASGVTGSLFGGDASTQGNRIVGNTNSEMYLFNSSNNTIQGNILGYPITSTATSLSLDASSNNNTIGSSTLAYKNTINDVFVNAYTNAGSNGDIPNQNLFWSQFDLPPITSPKGAIVTSNVPVTLQVSDFGYQDPNNDPFYSITVTSLPLSGDLLLDGVAISMGQEILAADIAAGKLTYLLSSLGKFSFTYTVSDGALSSAPAQFLLANPIPIQVTNLNNSGAGSLRQAILDANASAGFDIIHFDGLDLNSGTQMTISSLLPTITEAVFIDATTAGGYSFGTQMFTIFTNYSSSIDDGFNIQGNGTTIKGFMINRSYNYGINILSGSNYTIENNVFGINASGNLSANWYSINFTAAGSGSIIRNNVISGSESTHIYATSQTNLLIEGNKIGTNVAGTAGIPNPSSNPTGILLSGTASGALILNNQIAGKMLTGIQASSQTNLTIQGNLIGTDYTGTNAIGTINTPISLTSSSNVLVGGDYRLGEGNIIFGSTGSGITLSNSSNVVVEGNIIGKSGSSNLFSISSSTATIGSTDIFRYNLLNDVGQSVNATGFLSGNYYRSSYGSAGFPYAPVNTVSGSAEILHNTAQAFNLSVADPDSPTLEVTLSVSHGTLTLASLAGLVVNGNETSSVTLSGLIADINNALTGLIFNPTTGYYGPDQITMVTSDLGTDGTKPVMTDTDTISLQVLAAPVNTAPATAQTTPDTPLVLNLSVADADSATLSVTLNATHAILTLASVSGLTVGGNNTSTVTLSGSSSSINDALNGLIFNPESGYHGPAQITLTTADAEGNSDSDTIAVTVSTPPVATDNTLSGTEDTVYVFSVSDFTYNDAEGDPLDSVKITSFPASGTFKLNGSDLVLDSVVSAADITAGLLTFEPGSNFNGALDFNFLVNAEGQDSNTALITVNFAAVNDAPVAGGNTLVAPDLSDLTLTTADFAYSDAENDAFASITITALPTSGHLKLNGVAVQVNDVISAADIAAGKLTYTAGYLGSSAFDYTVSDGSSDSTAATMTLNSTYTIVVTNLLNTGAGSLRQAILDSNARGGLERITFNLDVATLQTINITSVLATFTGPVIIDGTTALNYLFGSNMVQVRGPASSFAGFIFGSGASGSTLRGLNIINMGTSSSAHGISVTGGNNYTFDSNVIGIDLTGTISRNYNGINFSTSGSGSVVSNSVISGNQFRGISTSFNQNTLTIENNIIGLDITGTVARGNNDSGIHLSSSSNSIVRDNVVSGNANRGISISSGTNNIIENNRVGTNAAGTAAIGNTQAGIYLTSGSNTGHLVKDNLVSGNTNYGIQMEFTGGATVRNNIIGMDATGTYVIGNGNVGLQIVAVTNSTFRENTVIGNKSYEARFSNNSDNNIIQGNTFGYPSLQIAATSLDIDGSSNNNTIGSAVNPADKNTINDLLVIGYSDAGGNGDIVNQNIFTSQLGNFAPTTSPNGAVVTSNTPVTLQISDFGYVDPNSDPFYSITVTSLPLNGDLTLDGVNVSIGQEILAADIAAGKLSYLVSSLGKFSFNYTVSDGALSSASAQFNLSNPVPILVTNLNDSGAGSLRQAIIDANASVGFDIINFSLAISSGARTINLLTILPTITESVRIDGTTAGGYDFGTNMVTLFGNNTIATRNAFRIEANNVTVKGFDIVRFYDPSINVVSGSNHLFENNIIGLDLDGNVSANYIGFQLSGGGSGTIIRNNVISGNTVYGIYVSSQNALTIQGNLIGTDRLGTLDKGNNFYGIYISGGSGHQIIDNVISGNNSYGVSLSSLSNATVQGNKIGVGLDGVTRIANSSYGLYASGVTGSLFGGDASTQGNLIVGNTNSEMYLSNSSNNTIQGNILGYPITSTATSLSLDANSNNNTVGSSTLEYKNTINDVFVTAYSNLGSNGDIPNQNLFYSQLGNLAPVTSPNVLLAPTNVPVTIQTSDFGYRDPNSDPFHSITVTSLPLSGNLLLDGVNVSIGQEILAADINAGKLTYTAASNGRFSFGYTVSDGLLSSAAAQMNLENPTPIVVTNLNDSGAGSLRQAIIDANASAGLDIIHFSVNAGQQFNLLTTLPTITDAVIIDGTTASGYVQWSNMLILEGTYSASGPRSGFIIQTNNTIIRGFNINYMYDYGINITGGGSNNIIENNLIGIRLDGTARGNYWGINLSGSGLNNTIQNNVISGSANAYGIQANSQTNLLIEGNKIGTSVDGMSTVSNATYGITTSGGTNTRIIGNTISSNNSGNILASTETGIVIQGNYIGTNSLGTAALSNSSYGIRLSGGSDALIGGDYRLGEGNVIFGNASAEIQMSSSVGARVEGNIIGKSGSVPLFSLTSSTPTIGSTDIFRYNLLNDVGQSVNATGFLSGNYYRSSYGSAGFPYAPVNTVPGSTEILHNTAQAFNLSVADPDSTTLEVALSASHGTLTLASLTGLTVNGNGTSSVTLSGLIADINNALTGLIFNPTTGYYGSAQITMVTSDLGTDGTKPVMTDTDTISLQVLAPPVNSAPATAQTAQDIPLVLNLSVADADSSSLQVTLNAVHGTLTLASVSGLTVGGNNTSTVTLSGSSSSINNALTGLIFNPTTGYYGSAQITLTTADAEGNSDSDTVAVTIFTPPVNTVPSTLEVNRNSSVTFDISVSDPGSATLEVTVSATNGTINGVSSITFSDTTANVNAALQNLVFTPNANYYGPALITVATVDAWGSADTDTISVTVAAPPVNSVPAALFQTDHNHPVVLSNVSVADPDSSSLQVTLQASSGRLSLASTNGLTVSGNGSASLALSGPVANINAALAALNFIPANGNMGLAQVIMTTTDLGGLSDTSVINIQVYAVANTVSQLPFNRAPTSERVHITADRIIPTSSNHIAQNVIANTHENYIRFRINTSDTSAFETNPEVAALVNSLLEKERSKTSALESIEKTVGNVVQSIISSL